MTNPYWHAFYKPHLTDRGEIRRLCFDISNIITASRSKQGSGEEYPAGEEPVPGRTEKLCFEIAEGELSRKLLRLALLIRTFDDTMVRDDAAGAYTAHRKSVDDENGPYSAVYKGNDNLAVSLRECSNKIIHAEDVRPTYDTEDDRDAPHASWGMTGALELEGSVFGKAWDLSIQLDDYLDGVLHLIEFDDGPNALPE
ncbi:hypothetical protein [Bosea sp. BIWAKO-01]|uniref:hypothetical protein n=1 Tax=Bosea sp. BIWAKO-01 TaxID=506668 RepID=UPI000853E8AC|nr:hypothetical protein [Bosea sp. BIWAKO-01]GAU84747.1 hypothetical protein BIWAKO_04684 [Bosea sp. BIWAKO-01]